MINALELVSISDFVLSILCLFFSGILFAKINTHFGRYGMLCYFMLFAGLSAFTGGIDHGFFEPINQRYYPRTLTYIFVAFATYALFRYTVLTYVKGVFRRGLLVMAFFQFVAFLITSFYYHNFMLVVANYTPVLLFFFIMNVINVNKSSSEYHFTIFCIIMIAATTVQALELNLSSLVNSDTLFHIIAFFGYFFMFKGAKKLTEI